MKQLIQIVVNRNSQALSAEQILKNNNYEVIVSNNIKDSLTVINHETLPDLILAEINNFYFCEIIHQKHPGIPVIIFSDSNNKTNLKKAFNAGAAEYISIPFQETELLKRIENSLKLKESERRLRETEKTAKLGHWELNLNNNHLFWSDEIYNIFGLSSKEFPASYAAFLNTVHPADRDFVNRKFTESTKYKKPYDIIHRVKLKNGIVKYVHEQCKTYYDQSDKPIRSFGTVQDISVLKKYEVSLLKAKHQVEKANKHSIFMLAIAAEYKDKNTGRHIKQITDITIKTAIKLGIKKGRAKKLGFDSMLHDIGKLGIPDSILLKPGKLTHSEFEIIKTHTKIGASIIGNEKWFKQSKQIALYHHERWDGNGYPEGLKKEEIPLSARIVAVVDVFDALISERPYKKPWSKAKATQEIKACSGKNFDPKVVEAFLQVITE